jgi:hypothetical protein
VTKPIYEYLPHFLRGHILLRSNQLPVIPININMRLLAAPQVPHARGHSAAKGA